LAEQAIEKAAANAIVHTPFETTFWLDANVVAQRHCALPMMDRAFRPMGWRVLKGPRGEPEGHGPDGGPGTGLGLAIAKGIMEAHGGAIKGESPAENGRGARFIMTFPREEPPA
jgi:two-component system sensor histidine kinase KdpD